MKKIIALVFTVLLVFSLIACGNTTVDSGIKTDSSVSDSNGTENTASSDFTEQETSADAKVLVAYFSRTGENYGVGVIEKGNTEIIAEMIAAKTSGDLFRIESVNAYMTSCLLEYKTISPGCVVVWTSFLEKLRGRLPTCSKPP